MLEHLGKSNVSTLRICFVYASTDEGINRFMLVSTYANLQVCADMRPGLMRSQNTNSGLTRILECARNYSDMTIV